MTGFTGKVLTKLGWLTIVGSALTGHAAGAAPPLQEVLDLLKTNLVGADAARLEESAVEGLLKQLSPQVAWVTNGQAASVKAEGPSVSKTAAHDGAFGYLRISRVDEALPKEAAAAMAELSRTNKIKGWVLDLRFAAGHDYRAAAAVADRFVPAEQPLLDWGGETARSTAKDDAVRVPVTVLVNRHTAAAAEALAAVLRKTEVALLLGTNTAGQAFITKDFKLRSGRQLRIATALIKVGGHDPVPLTGVKPDILVPVSPADERAYFEDAFRVLAKSSLGASGADTNLLAAGTNRPRHRINEAELVRLLREGEDAEGTTRSGARSGEPVRLVVRDPVLARALDLLKGLSVVKRGR